MFDKTQALTNPNNKQSSKNFVFYNPDLVTNKYTLIHSEARGEIYNTRWRLLLHKRDTAAPDLDQESTPDRFGEKADDSFNNPR